MVACQWNYRAVSILARRNLSRRRLIGGSASAGGVLRSK
jgi:hypothetical protein